MPVEHRVITIYGRVQGVFYRQSTRAEAQRLGLVGNVRNNPDGTVTIKAEGVTEMLDALEEWCHQGPPAAHVTQVQSQPEAVRGYPAFTIE